MLGAAEQSWGATTSSLPDPTHGAVSSVENRRKEIFLATKIDPRDRDGALRSMETSLKFLQTDYVELKAHKIARFIGITGHNDGAAMAEALRRHEFDTVLMSLNAAQSANPIAQRRMEAIPAFEQSALPIASQKNMGILSMKVMGQGMLVGTGTGAPLPPTCCSSTSANPSPASSSAANKRPRSNKTSKRP